jgi:hypothetical protein
MCFGKYSPISPVLCVKKIKKELTPINNYQISLAKIQTRALSQQPGKWATLQRPRAIEYQYTGYMQPRDVGVHLGNII